MRIKISLKRRFPELSQKKIKALLADKKVLINGKIAKTTTTVSDHDDVKILDAKVFCTLKSNPNVDCRLLKKTSDYIYFEKGPFVHSVAHDFDESDTAANWLLSVDENLSEVGKPLESGLMHRLDEETSGVMVAARNRSAYEHLKKLFREKKVVKEYFCLVSQRPPKPGLYKAYAGKNPKSAKRVLIRATTKKGLSPIQTEILESEKTEGFHRLHLKLITGYRHQIRAHLAFLGCPIVGDKIYGGVKAARLMLHAERIGFESHEIRGLLELKK